MNRFMYKEEGGEAADGELVVEHHLAADCQQPGLGQVSQHLGAGPVDGVDVGGVVVGVPVLADHVAMVDHVAGLAVVGGDHPDPVEVLRQVSQHVGDAVTHPVIAPLRSGLEPQRADDQQWHHHQHRVQGQEGVGGEQHAQDDHHGQGLHRELSQAVLQQLLQVLDVAGHAAHDHAGLLIGVEVQPQALQVGEHPDPQVVHDQGRQPAGDLYHGPLGHGRDPDRDHVEDGDGHHDRHVLGDHAVIDSVGDQGRSGLVGHGHDDDEHRRPQGQTPVPAHQAAQRHLPVLARPGPIAERDFGVGVFGLVSQQAVHALLHLPWHPGERQPAARIGGRAPAAGDHRSAHHPGCPPSSSTTSKASAWASTSA